jgi:hypothetical protein
MPTEAQSMSDAHSSKQSFPLSQREVVGLALQRGVRRPHAPVGSPHSQRERVRLALALGVGGGAKGAGRSTRRGIYR